MAARFSQWVTLLFLGALVLPVHANTDFSLQLRWLHQFQFAGYYVAKEQGYYADAGLNITIREGGPDTLKPVQDVLSSEGLALCTGQHRGNR